MTGPSPAEQKRAERLAREAREREESAQREFNARHATAAGLVIGGVVFIVIGLWFLWVEPGNAGSEGFVNLQRLTIGESSTIAGSVLLVGGLLLRYQNA